MNKWSVIYTRRKRQQKENAILRKLFLCIFLYVSQELHNSNSDTYSVIHIQWYIFRIHFYSLKNKTKQKHKKKKKTKTKQNKTKQIIKKPKTTPPKPNQPNKKQQQQQNKTKRTNKQTKTNNPHWKLVIAIGKTFLQCAHRHGRNTHWKEFYLIIKKNADLPFVQTLQHSIINLNKISKGNMIAITHI